MFLGYSTQSRAYCIFNKKSHKIEESIHVLFDETDCQDVPLQDTNNDDFGLIPLELPTLTNNPTSKQLESVDLDTNNHKHSSQQQEQEPHTNIVESVSSTNKVSEGPDIPQAPPHIIPRHPPTQVI
ncbi:hypothetical protein LINGRAHAP2_LOCUS4018 [Linum grandiflorum]